MDDSKKDLIREWLEKVGGDRRAAQLLAQASPENADTAVFHCQQAAEKSIKAFLVLHDVRIERTHNISYLLGLASAFDPGFHRHLVSGERLTPYATTFRYPGSKENPERLTVSEAMEFSEAIVLALYERLPVEVGGSGADASIEDREAES